MSRPRKPAFRYQEPPPVAVTFKTAGRMLEIGETAARNLGLPTVPVGNVKRVPVKAIVDFVNENYERR